MWLSHNNLCDELESVGSMLVCSDIRLHIQPYNIPDECTYICVCVGAKCFNDNHYTHIAMMYKQII